jgi:UDP-N-acetylmuramoyl-tripeptide--D-alanyl-D-alanine ligase
MFPGVCIAIPHWRDNGKQFSMRKSVLMEPRNLQYMADACAGQQLKGSISPARRLCTDSRQVRPGDLFLALEGDRFDGHSFLDHAAAAGAIGLVVNRAKLPGRLPACGIVAVENTRVALGQIAARYRQDFTLPIVAVAGSNGKTTTKELIGAVLRERFRTLMSRASFNNDIGVPSTLLELELEHEVAVLEFGTNHPGELAALLRLAQPQYGVITSIGREHLEFFGDLSGVIEEEGWLAELLPPEGKLFLNGDTAGVAEIARRSSARVVLAGFGQANAWRAHHLRVDGQGVSFAVESPVRGFNREFRINLLGRHQVSNALLAMAVAAELGLSSAQVQDGLAKCVAPKMRLQPRTWNGVQILDDSYNANADSTRAALETLQGIPCGGRRVAALGDMAELGEHAAAAHVEIGRYAAAFGVEHLVTVGKMAETVAAAARDAGLASVAAFTEVEQAAEALRQFLRPGDVLLLKGSRASGLDKIGELLLRDDPSQRLNSLGKQ